MREVNTSPPAPHRAAGSPSVLRRCAVLAAAGMLAVAAASHVSAAIVSERWGTGARDAPATHPRTLTISRDAGGQRIVFDLSAIPRGATVHSARLYCFTQNNQQPAEPPRLLVVDKLDTAGQAVPGSRPLELVGPWYRWFDATAAVRRWVAEPSGNLGILIASFDRLLADRTVLDVVYDGQGASPPPQVENLCAIHRNGQTFLVWKEHPDYRPQASETVWIEEVSERGDRLADGPGPGAGGQPRHPGITLRELRRLQGLGLRDKPSGFQGIRPLQRVRDVTPVRYRIYRHTGRITADNLHGAELLAEVDPLNAYDEGFAKIVFKGEYIDQMELGDSVLPTIRIAEDRAVMPGEACYVHTPRSAGRSWYAVTSVVGGTENARDIGVGNSIDTPVEESVAEPRPVRQFIQRDRYKDDVPEHWFRYFGAPPYYHLPFRSFRIAVGVPAKLGPASAMSVHTIASTWNVREALNLPSSTAVTLAIEQIHGWMPDLCYNEGHGTLRGASSCRVDFFSERYMLRIIEWAAAAWGVDRTRISSSQLHLGLRHPEVFATMSFGAYTATYDYRWAPGSGSLAGLLGPQGIRTVDGEDAWSQFSVSWYVNRYPSRDIPFLICMSNVGKDVGHTSEFGWQDDPRGWAGLLRARQTFVASWSAGFSHELHQGLSRIDWTKTVPAFSNCSLDNNPGNGDPADGDYYGTINGWLMWDNDSIDRPDRWEITVWVLSSCPRDRCTVDITPRRCRAFRPKPGTRFDWSNTPAAGAPMQSGQVVADEHGLVTVRNVAVSKGRHRVAIWK